ncbi:MAG: hypothetical protein ACJ79H_07760 [Myxococcales bacterium]
MLVYGDHHDEAEPRDALAAVEQRVVRGDRCGALIEGGRLAQALLDAEQEEIGCDDATPLSRACMALLLGLARGDAPADLAASFEDVAALIPGGRVFLRVPEGYAFYAVFPQLYAMAAQRAPRGLQALGIRSIGTSLAAAVAAASAGPAPLSVRPRGHPHARVLSLSERLKQRLDPRGQYAIVDEGPGLSGTSFIAVVDELLARGVAADRIHLFPSHAGPPGPQAPARVRALWPTLRKHVVAFDLLLRELPLWVADLTGPLQEPLADLSGGAWRALLGGDIPPSNVRQERRKYLLRSADGTFLLKFAGLGAVGEEVARRARAVAAAGFGPEVLGLRNGFLVQRWVERAEGPPPGAAEVAAYLAFRSRALPARPRSGASPSKLLEMAEHNSGRARPDLRRRLDDVIREQMPVEIDGRLHPWEWLRDSSGRLLKTDAADHCRAHDLVGCQDAAWDIAGACIELGLDETALVGRFRASGGRGASPEVLAFLRPCYLAFQLGAHRLAAESLPGEAARLHRAADRYARLLSAAS